ncbi:MAG: hypothetical protein WEC33_07015 [Dehalococcoidia bacterium]
MPRLNVDDLQFDEYNEAEMRAHQVAEREVWEVFEEGYELLRNAKRHLASHLMVGKTLSGRWLTIPIARTPTPGVWRPATAFPAREQDRAKLKGRLAK